MKIKIIHSDYDEMATLEIEVNGKNKIWAGPGEPEDMYLERDLSFVYDIVPLMKEAWQAGRDGETFDVTEEDEDE